MTMRRCNLQYAPLAIELQEILNERLWTNIVFLTFRINCLYMYIYIYIDLSSLICNLQLATNCGWVERETSLYVAYMLYNIMFEFISIFSRILDFSLSLVCASALINIKNHLDKHTHSLNFRGEWVLTGVDFCPISQTWVKSLYFWVSSTWIYLLYFWVSSTCIYP